ncbi:anthranilate synthase component I family protein [Leucobacter sp. CSA1]|uniref:Anthranilate synthase component I family protein n=1 Tax=Leucobacter chromiisoli TaxID=2796471 RepID=A0A934UUA1_9MICO|nr:anthranilate synthase component I family protein [Leucobacter chromiisoli]MBK0418206.1 anthranilate synthase component I family protein [Leucobacter chromiisoli]
MTVEQTDGPPSGEPAGAARSVPCPVTCPEDPAAVARSLAGAERPWFWFDGETAAPGEPRVSTLGVASELRIAEPGGEREFLAGLRAEHPEPGGDRGAGLHHGWVVALGYEFGVTLMGLDPLPDAVPAAFALRVDGVLAVDHESGTAELRGDAAALAELLGELPGAPGAALAEPNAGSGASPAPPRLDRVPYLGFHPYFGSDRPERSETTVRAEERDAAGPRPTWRSTETAYAEEVEACRSAIRDGDAYVLCLTDTAEVPGDFDPLGLFLRLRERGGAVRGGVVVAGDRALVSASPERFLSVRDRRIRTHPIKGTRPRDVSPERDAELRAELAADPKERAENLMIVDLMRNDLSRVCGPGTVSVERFLDVETHPHVHQLVSTVAGMLRADADVFDAVEACFPGGSMTGAPKRRAVEILAALERGPRGLYSGCFGWVDDGGDAELAMTIRSIELRGIAARGVRAADGTRDAGAPGTGTSATGTGSARVGAGGGITVDSDPERELGEKELKAAPLLAALGYS